MKTTKIASAAAILFLFSLTLSYGADVAKIGVVDFQRILEVSSAGKSAQTKIKSQGEKMETDLKKKGSELEELKKRLEREVLVMSSEMREEKEREFRIKINDFKSLEKKYKEEFKILNNRLVNRIKKDVFELIEEIGKKEGYLLIVEKREAGVLYSPTTIDITDKLIPLYNDKVAQQAKKDKK
ncbi:MAG: OmpH family outer membrane protein [Deltaproteobacteria bacterium]|nr:OmpH family outer membrane protein [Deltaproteobacteria bacterium]